MQSKEKNIKPFSTISDKIQILDSAIHGKGMFAMELIKAGEMVCVKGGYVLNRNNVFSSACINSYLPVSDELCVASPSKDEEERVKLYFNHSCNPSCGIHGEITFVAIRDIQPGEELTVDYAFIDNEEYSFECQCGSAKCRHTITGFDWKIKRLQDEYYPYFAQYLKDKIDKSKE